MAPWAPWWPMGCPKLVNGLKNQTNLIFGRIGKASSQAIESRFGISVKNYPRNLFLVQKRISRIFKPCADFVGRFWLAKMGRVRNYRATMGRAPPPKKKRIIKNIKLVGNAVLMGDAINQCN